MKLLPLALLLTGCANSEVFHGDLAFTQEERAAIETGATVASECWGEPRIEIVWDGQINGEGNRIVKAVPTIPFANGQYWNYKHRDIIWIHPRLFISGVYMVFAHEVGHYYGHGHHAGPGFLGDRDMYECSAEDRALYNQGQ